MKFQTKILVSMVLIVLISNGIFLLLISHYGKELIFQGTGSSALSIAATTAAMLDTDRYETINLNTQENSPVYKYFENQFKKVRDANRRKDVHVKFIYSLFPDLKKYYPDKTRVQHFGVSSEEEGIYKTKLGTIYRFKALSGKWIDINYNEPTILPEFINDMLGTWLSVLYPIKNSQGKLIGNIRVDVSAEKVINSYQTVLFFALGVFIATLFVAVFLAWLLARFFSRPLNKITKTLQCISQGNLNHPLDIHTKDEFSEVAKAIKTMTDGLKQREMLQASLTRYVSHALAEKIIHTGELPELSSERRKVTIMVCDIRGFTSISEHIKPEYIVEFLNEFFKYVIEAITAEQGILDKYLGDGFLAIFGSPRDDLYQEEHAIKAALKIRNFIPSLNQKWREKLGYTIKVGIGINTGSAIVGNIGSDVHMEYTAIGDTVNLAARLEAASKELNSDIIVSEYTYIAADHAAVEFKELGVINVKGRQNKVKVYTV